MIKLSRDEMPGEGLAFVAMPYGMKALADGTPFDFDDLYHKVYAPTLTECGMTPERADHIFDSTEGVLEAVWRGLQRAEVVIVDCTTRSADVSLEIGWTMALGKRMVVLAQRLEDIPTDLRGRVRPILYELAGLGVAGLMHSLKEQVQIVRQETVIENTLVLLKGAGTEPMPGTVISVTKDRAVVETDDRGCRQLWELSNADVDYARIIPDMTRTFQVGARLSGAVDRDFAGVGGRYTLLADQSNPWPGVVTDFPPGKVFATRVANVCDGVGAFISVTQRINGFVAFAEARQAGLERGTEVEAEVTRVDVAARKVWLHVRRTLTQAPVQTPDPSPPGPVTASPALPAVGTRLLGYVTHWVPQQDQRGGFILLRLKGYEDGPTAILHFTKMTQELRDDLNDSQVDLKEEEIPVEVVRIDAVRNRIAVRECPESDAAANQASAA